MAPLRAVVLLARLDIIICVHFFILYCLNSKWASSIIQCLVCFIF